jgi:hypothetical protein
MESKTAPSTPPKIPGVNTTELHVPPPQKEAYEKAKILSSRKLFTN